MHAMCECVCVFEVGLPTIAITREWAAGWVGDLLTSRLQTVPSVYRENNDPKH